jgi:hemerythrin-like metal-binding protein
MSEQDWLELLALDVPEIDGDHRVMLELNRAARRAARDGDPDRCKSYLKRLVAFAADHFVREEAFLRRHAHPDVQRHSEHHSRIMDGARGLVPTLDEASDDDLRHACDALLGFIMDDIGRCDAGLKTFVRSKHLTLGT